MFKYFCTQNVPINTKKIPTKPIITGFVGIYLFTQTPTHKNLLLYKVGYLLYLKVHFCTVLVFLHIV